MLDFLEEEFLLDKSPKFLGVFEACFCSKNMSDGFK